MVCRQGSSFKATRRAPPSALHTTHVEHRHEAGQGGIAHPSCTLYLDKHVVIVTVAVVRRKRSLFMVVIRPAALRCLPLPAPARPPSPVPCPSISRQSTPNLARTLTQQHSINTQPCRPRTSSDTTSRRLTRRCAHPSFPCWVARCAVAGAEVFPPARCFAISPCARHRLACPSVRLSVPKRRTQLSKYPTLNNIEARTNVPKAYGVLGFTTVFASLVFFNVAAGFLSTLLGWALPAYFSLKALETPSHGDDTQWLTYWVVFGAFQIVEYFAGAILYW